MNKTTIAVVGGGFTGLCVATNLIRLLRRKKQKATITLFEPSDSLGGRTFSPQLPDNFRLNHEANFMGAVNAFSEELVGYDDFYKWIQQNKNIPLASLNGQTITSRYKDLDDPRAYHPRSLFGHYLAFRFQEVLAKPKSKYYKFIFKKAAVTNVREEDGKFFVESLGREKTFDIAVLCTGFWYNKQDNCNLLYAQDTQLSIPSTKSLGIVGTSLSAIEISLALAEKGYKDITMFSRHGRLPKVRGKVNPYTPKYIKNTALEKLRDKYGYIKPSSLVPLLKLEFDWAYEQKNAGLYQRKGVNWLEVLTNKNPIKQLQEDIRLCEQGEELVWRSVLSSLYEYEFQLWRNLHRHARQKLLTERASMLQSYIGPMPLFQAKKLLAYIKKGTIKVVGNVKSHAADHDKTIFTLKDGTKMIKDYVIDARGPSKNAENMPFFNSLMQAGLLEKNPAGGILVNKQMQVVVGRRVFNNMYAVGPMVYGQRPHNSSVFNTEYVEHITAYIVNSIMTESELHEDEYTFSQYDYLTSFTF
jgi:uncharacterized NAD(P)/FAD-binding protein YdhS